MSSEEVGRRTVQGAVAVTLRGVVVRAVGLLTNLVLARLLSPAEFGLLAVALAFAGVATVVSQGGLGISLVRHERDPAPEDVAVAVGFQLVVTLIVASIGTLLGAAFGGTWAVIAVMLWALPFSALRTPSGVHVQRTLRFWIFALVNTAETTVYSVVAIAGVWLGYGLWAPAVALVCRAAVGTAAQARLCPGTWIRPRVEVRRAGQLAAVALPFHSVTMTNVGQDYAIQALTAWKGSYSSAGEWSLATRLLQPVTLLFGSLQSISFGAASRWSAARRDPVAGGLRAVAAMSAPATLLASLCIAAGGQLVVVLFGAKWEGAELAIVPGAAALVLSGPTDIALGSALLTLGRVQTVLRVTVASAAAAALVTAWLATAFGALGPGLGLLAGALLKVLLYGRALAEYGEKRLALRLCLPAAAATFAGVAGLAAGGAAGSAFNGVLVGAVVGTAVASLMIVVLGRDWLRAIGHVGRTLRG